jgi:hypothetical protein
MQRVVHQLQQRNSRLGRSKMEKLCGDTKQRIAVADGVYDYTCTVDMWPLNVRRYSLKYDHSEQSFSGSTWKTWCAQNNSVKKMAHEWSNYSSIPTFMEKQRLRTTTVSQQDENAVAENVYNTCALHMAVIPSRVKRISNRWCYNRMRQTHVESGWGQTVFGTWNHRAEYLLRQLHLTSGRLARVVLCRDALVAQALCRSWHHAGIPQYEAALCDTSVAHSKEVMFPTFTVKGHAITQLEYGTSGARARILRLVVDEMQQHYAILLFPQDKTFPWALRYPSLTNTRSKRLFNTLQM